MERLVVDGYGKYIGKSDKYIVVKEKQKVITRVMASNLRQVLIIGGGAIGFDALKLLGSNGVDLLVLDWDGKVNIRLAMKEMRTVKTRREQYYAYLDKRSGHICKNIVIAKIKNQAALLGTWAKSRKGTKDEIAEKLMESRSKILKYIDNLKKLNEDIIDNIRMKLLNIEGITSNIYWDGFSKIIPDEFGFVQRSFKGTPRYAKDPVNALLNYGYGVLEGEIMRAVHFAGLDPYGGFYHVDRPGRPSLVLDLMEEFRQQFVDRVVISMISKKEVNAGEFQIVNGLCRIPNNLRKKYISKLLEKLESRIIYKNIKVKWCDLMLNQARNIAKYLRREIPKYEAFSQRW
ncbi:MAG: CRISPR-associated endonuclease Cas1 [Candidatus Helarchaeota archaeon]